MDFVFICLELDRKLKSVYVGTGVLLSLCTKSSLTSGWIELKPDNTTQKNLISDLRNIQLERCRHWILENELRVLILQHPDFQWPLVLILLKSHLHDSMTQTVHLSISDATPFARQQGHPLRGAHQGCCRVGPAAPGCLWRWHSVCVACACVYVFHVPLCVS